MGFYTYNGGLIGTGEITSKRGVFEQRRAHHNSAALSLVTTSQITNNGLAGLGVSVSNPTGFSQSVNLTASNYIAGKRLVIVLFGFRDASGSYSGSRVPLMSTATLGGTSLTILDEGQSDFNSSCIAAGLVNLTGTQTFTATFTGTPGTGGDGYTAILVFDDVTSWNYVADAGGTNTSVSSLSIPGTAGVPTGEGQTVRLVGLNASNPSSAPTFTPSDGFSYTSWFSQDNGTNEFSVGYYFIDTVISGSQSAIAGTMSGATAGNGYGFAVADFKMYK